MTPTDPPADGPPPPGGPTQFSRRQFLAGAVAGGVALQSAHWIATRAARPGVVGIPVSYAQSGEDLIVQHVFNTLKLPMRSYLDVGAWEPIKSNNTYLFYTKGCRGVLVEPNPDLTPRLRRFRPRDTILPVGIGVTAETEADYYLVTDPSWNTFDKATAEAYGPTTGGKLTIKQVIKVPLVNINDVFAEHFGGEAPDFVSLDVEGFEVPILKSVNFEKYRPKVFCIETLVGGTTRQKLESVEFLVEKGYAARGATFPNTILVDKKLL